ncbi:hypothetical protein ACLB1T_00380 [Escherichia coli]
MPDSKMFPGGSATSTTINGGVQLISSGGSAVDTTIQSGIQEVVRGEVQVVPL